MLLDAVVGDPAWLWRRLPHPATLMGRLIAAGEARLNRGRHRRAKGAAFVAVISALALGIGAGIEAAGLAALEVVIIGVLLAQKDLFGHVRDVASALDRSIASGREQVARIVGRETSDMDEAAISRAAIESAAENLSDGVVAPIFWYLLGGIPGILFYKFINTADSMIGYRTARFAQFGWAAARLDDMLNWVPARLTAALIWIIHRKGNFSQIARDARRHRSPNAGWPEAAMARALGTALAGPRRYDGQMLDLAWVNPRGRREAGTADIRAAASILWQVWAAILAALTLGAVVHL